MKIRIDSTKIVNEKTVKILFRNCLDSLPASPFAHLDFSIKNGKITVTETKDATDTYKNSGILNAATYISNGADVPKLCANILSLTSPKTCDKKAKKPSKSAASLMFPNSLLKIAIIFFTMYSLSIQFR